MQETGFKDVRRFGRFMNESSFDSTPEFQQFRDVMRGVMSVPKKRVDRLVEAAKESSPRKGNPHAPGRKRAITRNPSESLQFSNHG
jgi:hypothetical protein